MTAQVRDAYHTFSHHPRHWRGNSWRGECPSIAWFEYTTKGRVHTNIIPYFDFAAYIFDEISFSLIQKELVVSNLKNNRNKYTVTLRL